MCGRTPTRTPRGVDDKVFPHVVAPFEVEQARAGRKGAGSLQRGAAAAASKTTRSRVRIAVSAQLPSAGGEVGPTLRLASLAAPASTALSEIGSD